jgi:flagellar hook-associated protein 3 FlgL
MSGITPGVSLLGLSTSQYNRLGTMSRMMDDLQRQIGTQKKYDSLTGFGLEAQGLLQLRADKDQLETYSTNIDSAVQNMKNMTDVITRGVESLNKLASLLQSQARDSSFDTALINSEARNALSFFEDIANYNFSGRYLFAGTDSTTAPLADTTALIANGATEIADWMAGINTTTQATTNLTNLSGTALGFSSSLSSAQPMTVRIGPKMEVSYGAIADRSGMQDAVRALGILANLRAPDPAVDTPTNTDFSDMIDYITGVMNQATTAMQSSLGSMSGTMTLAQDIQESHKLDINLYAGQVDKKENIDTAEVIARLQALQTQLSASYEATRIMSQLSLANYLS